MASEPDSDLHKLVGVGAAAVVAAFFLNPILPRFPPVYLLWTATLASTALIWFYEPWTHGRTLGWASIVLGVGFALIAFVLFLIALAHVERDQAANDRRCLAVQRDMLSARPRRADGPDLFQALGCRPQGEGSVYAPPRVMTTPRG